MREGLPAVHKARTRCPQRLCPHPTPPRPGERCLTRTRARPRGTAPAGRVPVGGTKAACRAWGRAVGLPRSLPGVAGRREGGGGVAQRERDAL